MQLVDFFDAVEADSDIQGVGVDDDGVLVRLDDVKYSIPFDVIERADWSSLAHAIRTGEGRLLHHMTRVVGYYSMVANWNKSKLGELKDRQVGDYALSER